MQAYGKQKGRGSSYKWIMFWVRKQLSGFNPTMNTQKNIIRAVLLIAIAGATSVLTGEQYRDDPEMHIAQPLQFPYAAAIVGGSVACTGSILSSLYILTSASCIFPMRNDQSDIKVLAAGSKKPLEVRGVKINPAYKIYPQHDITGADLALIQLASRMTIDGAYVDTINLPTSRLVKKPDANVGQTPLLASWTDVNQQLKYVGMPFMKQATCDKILSKAIDFRLDKDMICTDRKSHCNLIGGAALKLVDHGGKSLIAAVASGQANCSASQPRVFTRVEHHVEWIKKMMIDSDT